MPIAKQNKMPTNNYYFSVREKALTYQKEYYHMNKSSIQKYNTEYYKANREKIYDAVVDHKPDFEAEYRRHTASRRDAVVDTHGLELLRKQGGARENI